jgi:hypothetical protein
VSLLFKRARCQLQLSSGAPTAITVSQDGGPASLGCLVFDVVDVHAKMNFEETQRSARNDNKRALKY